jgi:hypothetical protein
MSSNGVTSSTSSTPAAARSGRAPATKSSSTTHWRNGSCITGAASRTPVRGEAVDVLGARRGHDAVDHGRGKAALGLDPAGERGIDEPREVEHDAAHDAAVLGEVVAGQHGEGRQPGGAAAGEAAHQVARRRARGLGVGEVVHDVGMGAVERAGRGLVAVALLGDVRVTMRTPGSASRSSSRAGSSRATSTSCTTPTTRRRLAVGAELDRGVGAVLGREAVALVGPHEADADDAPVAARGRHRLLDVERAVGAEEGAEPEVDDADARTRAGGAGEAWAFGRQRASQPPSTGMIAPWT